VRAPVREARGDLSGVAGSGEIDALSNTCAAGIDFPLLTEAPAD
jgi:hypothetical protein